MRSHCCPSTVHVHARVCTCKALIRGRGRMDQNAHRSLKVTNEGNNAMTRHRPVGHSYDSTTLNRLIDSARFGADTTQLPAPGHGIAADQPERR